MTRSSEDTTMPEPTLEEAFPSLDYEAIDALLTHAIDHLPLEAVDVWTRWTAADTSDLVTYHDGDAGDLLFAVDGHVLLTMHVGEP
jgi:hypothetical protein